MSNVEVDDLQELKTQIKELQLSIKQLDTKTKDVVEAFEAAKGAFRVLEFMGKLAKPFFWIATTSAGIYGLVLTIKNFIK